VSISDFRSDTVTVPPAAMRAAMASAEVGDDVLDGDPTVRALEERTAEWLGKDGSLFVPSGTMANQVALGAWTRPGDEIVVQRFAHVVTYESGAAGHLHGLQCITLGDSAGELDPELVRGAIRPDYIHCPHTALLCTEQTHNVGGGRVAPLADLEAIAALGRENGIPVHMDGARLANAVVAAGISADTWGKTADSVSICLSKGLGAPAGSMIAGDGEFIERARQMRKRLGGWMRQVGILAAAGLYAFDHNLERLADDHALARNLAERIGAIDGLSCDLERVQTNMVMVTVEREGWDAPRLSAALEPLGVRVSPMGDVLRFVTHLDVDETDVERCAQALAQTLS